MFLGSNFRNYIFALEYCDKKLFCNRVMQRKTFELTIETLNVFYLAGEVLFMAVNYFHKYNRNNI